ncbi:MAG TPA: hypothetical protein VGV67_02765, partial [Solirubrobacteraceae bacterium]|nr:hypothetical protein [Solirubrobacteraceae bacterium]
MNSSTESPHDGPPEPRIDAAEDLRGEISRGQRLDRDLARDLGRREPVRSAGVGDYVAALG